MDQQLESARTQLRARVDEERFVRERIGLGATRTIPNPTWITYGSEPFSVPLLDRAQESDESIILIDYFTRAIPTHTADERGAVGFLDHPERADDALRAYAEAGAGARRRYDVEGAVRSIDVTRLIEEHLHDTSPYGRSIREVYGAYQDAKHTCTSGTLEAHVGLAIDLGEELIASNAVRLERLTTIATHLGREAPERDPAWLSVSVLIDIARMIGEPLILTSDGLAIPDDAHTLLGAYDRFSEANARYGSAARTALLRTLERDPGLIAHADAYARSPSAWIQTIS